MAKSVSYKGKLLEEVKSLSEERIRALADLSMPSAPGAISARSECQYTVEAQRGEPGIAGAGSSGAARGEGKGLNLKS